MAVEREECFELGTTATVDLEKPSRSRLLSVAKVNAVTSISNALQQAITGTPAVKTIAGVTLGRKRVSLMQQLDGANALVAVDYGRSSGNAVDVRHGFNRFRVRLANEETDWITTPEQDNAAGTETNPGKKFSERYGNPNGKKNVRVEADGGRVIMPYRRTVTTMTIIVDTALTFNPLPSLVRFMSAPLNNQQVRWDRFSFPKYTLRFITADVNWIDQGNNQFVYDVQYIFHARMGGHFTQFVRGANEVGIALSAKPSSGWSGGFPVGVV